MDLADLTRKLAAREPIVHRGASTMALAEFETATAKDVWEVGASGTVHGRGRVWSVLAARGGLREGEWEASVLRCRQLGADTDLPTYR